MTLLDTAAPTAGALTGRLQPSSAAEPQLRAFVWTRLATLLAVASLSLMAAAAFSCWLATGAVVPWDSKNHFYPMFRFLADALQHGEFPLWNPYHFGGSPTAADPQSLLFSPSMVLFAMIAPHASMQAFDAVILGHLLFGTFGILCLFQRRGWHPVAAVLAGLIFMLGGAASSRLQHTGMIISYSFFPWALWALDRALEERSYRFAVLFGLCASLMVLGRDQVAFLLALVLIGRLLWQAGASGNMFAFIKSRLGVTIVMGVTVILIIGAPILLTMQFLGTSNRPGISYGVAVAGSLAPINLITLFAPNFFGSLDWSYDYWGPGYETIAETDWTDRCVNYLFVGSVPILLFLWHGLAGHRMFARPARFFVAILALAIVYAFGRETPVFSWAFDWLPGISLYRRPADATFVVNVMLALLSGYLLHRYIEDGLPSLPSLKQRWVAYVLPVVAGGLTAILFGAGLAFSLTQKHAIESVRELSLGAAFMLCAVLVLVFLRARRRRTFAAALLVLATGGELIWRNAASSMNAEPSSRYGVYSHLSVGDAHGLDLLQQEIASRVAIGDHPRIEILGLCGAWQNASMVLKLENTLGYNPLRISDYERAVGPGENAEDPNQRHFPGTFRGYRSALASLLGLEYLVLGRPLTNLPRHFPRPSHIQQFYIGDSMYIYKLGEAAPRTYVATKIIPADSEAVINDAVLPDFNHATEALIDGASLSNLSAPLLDGTASEGQTKATVTSYTDNAVTIDATTDHPGVVVLHDLFYPGWEVRVDGVKKPILHTNILFRGVEIPAGHHSVEFSFHPVSLTNLAAAASALMHKDKDDE